MNGPLKETGDYISSYRDRIEKVTSDDVHRVAKDYLKRNNRTVGMYIPTEKPERIAVPKTPDLASMIGEYKGREVVSAGEVFDVSPENIEARTKRITLSSGIKAAVLPKKTRNEAVNLRLTLRYGNEKNLHGLKTVCEFLPALMRRGTQKLSRQQLQDQLDKKPGDIERFRFGRLGNLFNSNQAGKSENCAGHFKASVAGTDAA